jgi:beta-galactosidase GanA
MGLCRVFLLATLSASLVAQTSTPARTSPSLPRIVESAGRFALLVDGQPYLMLGAQINNSSAWPSTLPKVWPVIEQLHANTVEAPIYWEQWEPSEGHFDPSVLHTLIDQAREHHVHLVLLWFGSWKNGSGHYTPSFIKLDEARVPHVVNRDGGKVDSLSPYSPTLINADRTAFTALMRELKAYDPEHTVLMVQVENEIGTYGSVRDFSAAGQKMFNTAVPENVLTAMHKQPGTWPEVFGKDADEFYYAWSIATDVNRIAAAGKAEDPLPLYINVATRNPINGGPGSYPSGGAVDTVIPIWKATAPAIDAFGVDMYDGNYQVWSKLLDLYERPDNPTFVPESSNAVNFARYFYTALGYGTIGYAVFGMDKSGYVNFPLGAARVDDEGIAPFSLIFATFAPMEREIAELNFKGHLQAVSEDPAVHFQTLNFGTWKAMVGYGMAGFGGQDFKDAKGNDPVNGGVMVAQLGQDEFLVTGVHARVDFVPTQPGKQRQFVRVEEGSYENHVWHMSRLWNGDQSDYGLNFTSIGQVLRVTVATY